MIPRRVFAVIPAAGQSRRMGAPKLLQQIQGKSLIRHLLRQLQRPELAAIFLLVRQEDSALQSELQSAPVRVVTTQSAPPDMKSSVSILLQAVEDAFHPRPDDGWLLIPADHPVVEADVLERLLQAFQQDPESIHVPCHAGRRGHPTIFPWKAVDLLSSIPGDQGLNWLLHDCRYPVRECHCDADSVLWDVDTPEDLQRIRRELGNGNS